MFKTAKTLALGLAVVTAVAIPASANAAAEYIYWSNSVAGGIGRTAADGTGSRDAAFVGSATASGPQFLTVSGNWLYWARSGGIGRVQLGGTGATNSFFTTGVTLRASIASDATYVYFAKAELFNNSLGRVPISGGAAMGSPSFSVQDAYKRALGAARQSCYGLGWRRLKAGRKGRAHVRHYRDRGAVRCGPPSGREPEAAGVPRL